MEKEVIILTKSDKNGGYCVAGIDMSNGRFIRLVSEDEQSEHALFNDDIKYRNGECLEVMDIISVKLKNNQNCWFQPENYVIDSKKYFNKIGVATVNQVKDYLMNQEYIFYNDQNSILSRELQKQLKKYSLLIVELDELKLWRDKFKDGRIMASFSFNSKEYRFIKITDHVLTQRYNDMVQRCDPYPYVLNNVLVVFSLAGAYNNSHYKLIANIIEDASEENFENEDFGFDW